jgi:hypothetical protein
MDWLFEASRDIGRRFPRISIPDVASIVYWALWYPMRLFLASSEIFVLVHFR